MNNPLQSSSDIVEVCLTPAGQAAANGESLTVHGIVSLTFTGSVAQPVHRAVWSETLSTIAPFGKPWFEIVPAIAATSTAAPAPSTTVTAVKTTAAVVTMAAPITVTPKSGETEAYVEAERLAPHPASSAIATAASTTSASAK